MSSEFDIPVDLSGLQGGEDQCLKLRQLLLKHKDVFASHDLDLGDASTVEHAITVNSSQPTAQTFRRIPPNQYNEVKKHIQQLIDCEIVN